MPPRGDLRDTLAAAWVSLGLGLRQAFASWPVLAGRGLFFLVALTIFSSLWDKVAAARLAHTLASALPKGGLTLYIGVTEWITLSTAAIYLRLEDDIRSGALEPHLLRPKPYLLQKVAESYGGTLARMIAIGATAIVALLISGRTLPPAVAFFYAGVLGLIGAAIGVLLFAITGLCAFWLRRVFPAFLIMQKSMFMFGGLFAPISLYPAWFYSFSVATPFAANMYFAGNQIIAPSGAMFVRAFGIEIAWAIAIAALLALMWRAGIRRVLREGMP